MTQTHPHDFDFLGVAFDALTLDQALAAISARASRGEDFAYVATPNVDHVVALAREPARAALYQSAWLNINDSRVLELLARFAARHLPAACGSDIVARLFEEEISPHEPVTIVGGEPEMIAALEDKFGLTNIRWHDAPMGLKHSPEAVADAAAFVAAQPSRYVFFCVGAPQQEMIAWAVQMRGDAKGVGLCIGAGLNFLTGHAKRAPKWMRTTRLEWLHRLASEPGRLARRYLVEGPKVFALWRAWMAAQRA
ncbi:MAG: WecB/TagA/CpsF family glycosyltransferase [Caulobacterales bacterium]